MEQGRIFAFGDVHGCAVALRALIEAIDPRPNDTLVFLGDYVDRGQDSRGVVETILELELRCRVVPILGNHEELLLRSLGDALRSRRQWLLLGGRETLDSYGLLGDPSKIPADHLAFFRRCRAYYHAHGYFFTHANYDPAVPLNCQPAQPLRWQFFERGKQTPHPAGSTVVVGHTPQRSGKPLDLGFAVCIDTNCCHGGWLTAFEVGRQTFWQANEAGRTRQLARTRTLAEAHIHALASR